LKTKCWRSSEFVVCGYRLHAERARALSELLVGYYDTSRRLHYAGAVGTGRGFGHSFRAQLRSELDAFAQASSPCIDARFNDALTRWVRPVVVVEIAYLELTNGFQLRHPSFRALRLSTRAESVVLTPAKLARRKVGRSYGRAQQVSESEFSFELGQHSFCAHHPDLNHISSKLIQFRVDRRASHSR